MSHHSARSDAACTTLHTVSARTCPLSLYEVIVVTFLPAEHAYGHGVGAADADAASPASDATARARENMAARMSPHQQGQD